MNLIDLIAEWLKTPGPSPKGGAQLESLGFSIEYPNNTSCSNFPINNDIIKAWLNYRCAPINWFCTISSDKIETIYHGDQHIILAADPDFFDKLTQLMCHIINSMSCEQCKAEIEQNYKLDQNCD